MTGPVYSGTGGPLCSGIGGRFAPESATDNQKAKALAKCVGDSLTVAQYSQDPFWREYAESLWQQFYSYARQLYTGPAADIDKYFLERPDQLLAYGREKGRPALLRKARAALYDPRCPLLLEVKKREK